MGSLINFRMSDPVDVAPAAPKNHFDTDYRWQSIGLGLIWAFVQFLPYIFWATYNGGGWTKGTRHAWRVMKWGTGLNFGQMTLFWLLSYIRKGKGMVFQRLYYRSMAWGIPFSWLFAFWVFLAFIIGGAQTGGEMGKNVLYWLMYWIILAGFEALAWWLAPSNVKFYKWDEQPWWNYNDKETPKNWPSQLGEFVDY